MSARASPERGQAAATDLGAEFVQLDVTDDASVDAAMDAIQAREGRLDVLVNNAGIPDTVGVEDVNGVPPAVGGHYRPLRVVIGQGTRLFPDTGPDRALELAESRATSNGVIIQVYRPNWRPQYGTATAPAWGT